jgi:3-methyladenine DNA glycosylase AlkD
MPPGVAETRTVRRASGDASAVAAVMYVAATLIVRCRAGIKHHPRTRLHSIRSVDTAKVAVEIEGGLRSAGDAARAEHEKRYLKSDLDHLGASVPAIRRVAKGALADHSPLRRDDLVRLVAALWARPVHECRMAAVELLQLGSGLLRADDMALIERLIRESKTWALVDGLAVRVAGALVEGHHELGATLDRWASDEDVWVRRSALLALLLPLRRGEGDFERLSRYADAMLEEQQFFIRKAIGWVLRETARKQPDSVSEWLAPRAGRASGVTVREAVKYLSDGQRTAILSANRGGRTRARR